MDLSHKTTSGSRSGDAVARLIEFIEQRDRSPEPVEDLEQFEREAGELLAAVHRDMTAAELSRLDVNVPHIVVDGVIHRQVTRDEDEYMSAKGPVRVIRSLYSTRQDGERAICPMEMRAGIIEKYWTPLASKQATWAVAHMTPGDGEKMFKMLDGMKPSKSSLDRLPKRLSDRWEKERERMERILREQEAVPENAVIVAVSLDGVMAPMRDGQRKQKRQEAKEQGKYQKGPAGYREVGCGTISFYDVWGDLILTRRMARMPEKGKKTLKQMLVDELGSVMSQRPELELVKIADGAKDNWTFLASADLPEGWEVVDFYHACEHLHAALAAAYGDTSAKCHSQFEKMRTILRDEEDGVEKIIRSLAYLRSKHPRRKKIADELGYFRRNRKRMRYAETKAQDYPIGSGVVEAACKTLVTQRMKCSGMRWGHEGGQAILTFRSLVQSDRFERGWELLKQEYVHDVTLPDNVVPLPCQKAA
jgi:hypothetical protein